MVQGRSGLVGSQTGRSFPRRSFARPSWLEEDTVDSADTHGSVFFSKVMILCLPFSLCPSLAFSVSRSVCLSLRVPQSLFSLSLSPSPFAASVCMFLFVLVLSLLCLSLLCLPVFSMSVFSPLSSICLSLLYVCLFPSLCQFYMSLSVLCVPGESSQSQFSHCASSHR